MTVTSCAVTFISRAALLFATSSLARQATILQAVLEAATTLALES